MLLVISHWLKELRRGYDQPRLEKEQEGQGGFICIL